MTMWKKLERFFTRENSKDIAKKRLQFALMYDKLETTDDVMKNLQAEIIDVISKYFVIDKDSINLKIKKSDDLPALVVNTPILSARRRQVA